MTCRIFALALIAAGVAFAGDDRVCAECHADIAARFAKTAMAQALAPVAACEILRSNPALAFQDGEYESRITREGDRSVLTVKRGAETLSTPLLWAFGRGQAGQTYVFERGGVYYESRVSFYNALHKLDVTMGALGSNPQNIEEAAGHRMSARDSVECFGCHSTGAVSSGRLHVESMVPGLGCGSCHGSTEKHVATGAKMPHLAESSAEEMSEMCGRCHRTWSQIAANGPRGVLNVRFQPYRLTNSKCYSVTDSRIRCSACHDPHGPVETSAKAYDAACGACHSAGRGKSCRAAKENCVSCHMPKIDLPGAHARFTDHQIRIVRAGEAYPNE